MTVGELVKAFEGLDKDIPVVGYLEDRSPYWTKTPKLDSIQDTFLNYKSVVLLHFKEPIFIEDDDYIEEEF